jgi:hypothetical protein
MQGGSVEKNGREKLDIRYLDIGTTGHRDIGIACRRERSRRRRFLKAIGSDVSDESDRSDYWNCAEEAPFANFFVARNGEWEFFFTAEFFSMSRDFPSRLPAAVASRNTFH